MEEALYDINILVDLYKKDFRERAPGIHLSIPRRGNRKYTRKLFVA